MIPYGPYYLVQRLTVGGMAEVFLATRREQQEGPLLVVKRILPHLQDRSDFVQMFLDEARLTSNLFHRNLVRVHDCGIAEGVHYIAMEYVDGLALSLVLRRQPRRRLPQLLGCFLVAEICAALGYAHGRTDERGRPLGIVHRDVSPDNILISREGEVKLADFGIAKAKIQLTRTRPGQLKGKYSYMSPEQGMRLQVDHRSDIFSAGLVLYEVTTGKRVFPAGNEVETLRALYDRRYTPPEQAVEDYPSELAAVVNRALAWDPDRRHQRAEDLRHDLLELIPAGIDPQRDLAVLVQSQCEQLQIKRPQPSDQSTKQHAPAELVLPPRAQRDTLLGVGQRAGRPRPADKPPPAAHTTIRDQAPAFEDPPVPAVLFPEEEPVVKDGESIPGGPAAPVGNDTEPMTAFPGEEEDLDDTVKVPRLTDDDLDPDA